MVRSLLVLAAMTGAAHAQVAMVDDARTLTWRAPADCPDAHSLRTRIEQRLARSLDGLVVRVDIDVVLAAGRYVARVDLRAVTVANDVRTLTSKHCGELADAVAVIIARVTSEQIAHRRTALRDDEEPAIAAEAPPAPPPPPRRWSLGARISAISGIGVLPKVGLGGEAALTLRIHSTLAEVAVTRWFASAAQIHDGEPAKVDVNLDVAAARFGWRPPTMPLRAWLGVEAGTMRGSDIALPSEQLASGRWIAAGAGFGVAWQMTRWARLVGFTESMVAIERVRFSLGDLVVYAPSPMSFRASCGLELGWQ